MGASSRWLRSACPDLFVEVAAMRALASQTHGSGTDAVMVPAHDHTPPAVCLQAVGDAFFAQRDHANALRRRRRLIHCIREPRHANRYMHPRRARKVLARGGELIEEESCGPVVTPCASFQIIPAR